MDKLQNTFSELKSKLISVGLSFQQAEEYVWFIRNWHRTDLTLGLAKAEDILPNDNCLRTLAEAQRIVTASAINKDNPRELHMIEIRRFLSTPDVQWKKAKEFIGEFFHRTESAVNTLYNLDEAWLLKAPEECLDVALYLNSVCPTDPHLVWKIFRYAGLLGRKKTEERIKSLFELLGYEDSIALIRFDVHHEGWLFYHHDHANPVRCIAYLKKCGLSNIQILELLSRDGYILYLFNRANAQAKIDSIINKFQYDCARDYGPCYDGLTLDEIDFLIHGPGKLKA